MNESIELINERTIEEFTSLFDYMESIQPTTASTAAVFLGVWALSAGLRNLDPSIGLPKERTDEQLFYDTIQMQSPDHYEPRRKTISYRIKNFITRSGLPLSKRYTYEEWMNQRNRLD